MDDEGHRIALSAWVSGLHAPAATRVVIFVLFEAYLEGKVIAIFPPYV